MGLTGIDRAGRTFYLRRWSRWLSSSRQGPGERFDLLAEILYPVPVANSPYRLFSHTGITADFSTGFAMRS
jgi:hypothetical protein